MIYMGSKNRLSRYLAPVIQSYITENTVAYIEPFVGGANMIDKIKCKKKIGCDTDRYVISTLNALKDGWIPPYEVSKEEYIDIKLNKDNYEDCLVGYIGYELSFGAKWFGGYVKRCDKKKHGDVYSYKSCMKQAPNLVDTDFIHSDFRELSKDIKNCTIYCDPPYKGTTKYKTAEFPYDEFYQWCRDMSKDNVVIVSEYYMPDDFVCIWEKESKVLMDSNRRAADDKNIRVEKLFIHSSKSLLK